MFPLENTCTSHKVQYPHIGSSKVKAPNAGTMVKRNLINYTLLSLMAPLEELQGKARIDMYRCIHDRCVLCAHVVCVRVHMFQ